jgi:tetratricopeptide (TPR) repeat protein
VNNSFRRKAGFLACLFFCLTLPASAQELIFSEIQSHAYERVWNLNFVEARRLIGTHQSEADLYILRLSEVIELLTTEDELKFHEYEENFSTLTRNSASRTNSLMAFVQTDVRLQWALVYLKFGRELDAALQIRNAYHGVLSFRERYPGIKTIYKTSGLLDVILGSVPEKYQWLLSVLGLDGDLNKGVTSLHALSRSSLPLSREASMLLPLIDGFLLHNTSGALATAKDQVKKDSGNQLLICLTAALAMKNSESEYALLLLSDTTLASSTFPYWNYLRGEVYLQKALYENAISDYKKFVAGYNGQNWVKDANYKIGLCHWLRGDSTLRDVYFAKARQEGKESVEADKYAARALERQPPNRMLSRLRYFTDGGFYEDALRTSREITREEIPTKIDTSEFNYRMARLHHKMKNTDQAMRLYLEVIESSPSSGYYFPANSCLHLGYLYRDMKNDGEAARFFRKAMSFKEHEYKNSVDSEAKSALAQMRRK